MVGWIFLCWGGGWFLITRQWGDGFPRVRVDSVCNVGRGGGGEIPMGGLAYRLLGRRLMVGVLFRIGRVISLWLQCLGRRRGWLFSDPGGFHPVDRNWRDIAPIVWG